MTLLIFIWKYVKFVAQLYPAANFAPAAFPLFIHYHISVKEEALDKLFMHWGNCFFSTLNLWAKTCFRCWIKQNTTKHFFHLQRESKLNCPTFIWWVIRKLLFILLYIPYDNVPKLIMAQMNICCTSDSKQDLVCSSKVTIQFKASHIHVF